ncbi:MAG: DUF1926 domain-containing protein [Chloroflexi bacterium]|nr:DUF1926 domain-containing protein [Chloroflexota bacterium]
MTGRIALALAIHNHQPVGNFGWVFEDVYRSAYEPLLQALERHPAVRLSLHYTGPLIEWLQDAHPDFLERLAALVARDQVEVLGGGYYEPVLVSLPERDRHGQLVRMADEVERLFGRRPQGAWLAERVWEPQLPSVLADAGYEWTILDDNHFRAAAVPEDAMWGAYVTEDQGRLLRVFGTGQGLRYRIPFGEPGDVITHLRDNATEDGHRLGFMGDDGEKFGAWPGTYEHCWSRNRWVDRFFGLIEDNASWLTTTTPSDWLEREAPIGRVYVPTASYVEMGEWALPPEDSNVFTALIKRATDGNLPERRFLRGGFWRNFQARYREINDLHKQMLRASAKVDAMRAGPAKEAARDHLFRGQSNDCYWHGLFGGIYIVHMRLATSAHLIAAEDLADATAEPAGTAEAEGTAATATAGTAARASTAEAGETAEALGVPMAIASPAIVGSAALEAQVIAEQLTVVAGGRMDGTPVGAGASDADAAGTQRHTDAGEATGEGVRRESGSLVPARRVPLDLATAPARGSTLLDADMDGIPEAYLAGRGQVVIVDVAEGATIATWDLRATRLALASVVRRRPEAYHATLVAHERAAELRAGTAAGTAAGAAEATTGGAPKTIHDVVAAKEPGLSSRLIYDRHERRSALLHIVPVGSDAEAFRRQTVEELADTVDDPYRVVRLADGELVAERAAHAARQLIVARKTLRIAGDRLDPSLSLDVEVGHHGDVPLDAELVLEWNIDLAGGGHNPAAWYEVPAAEPTGASPASGAGGARRFPHDSMEHPGRLARFAFANTAEGARIDATLDPAADVSWYPVETVSNSESGFERQYQGSSLLLTWPLRLAPGATAACRVRFDVTSSRDHRAQER